MEHGAFFPCTDAPQAMILKIDYLLKNNGLNTFRQAEKASLQVALASKAVLSSIVDEWIWQLLAAKQVQRNPPERCEKAAHIASVNSRAAPVLNRRTRMGMVTC
jgi:hypothetical protein